MRFAIILITSLLIGCETYPSVQQSERQRAQRTTQKHQAHRNQIRTIHYGVSMEDFHQALSNQYRPFMDVYTTQGQYSIDLFSVSYYLGRYDEQYWALYKNNHLIAIAPKKAVKVEEPDRIFEHHKEMLFQKCDGYTTPTYYETIIDDLQKHRVKDLANAFIPSEQDIQKEISNLSDIPYETRFGSEASEAAGLITLGIIVSPLLVFYPFMLIANEKHKKESDRRNANTDHVMSNIRKIPLGLTLSETNNLEVEKFAAVKRYKNITTKCSISVYKDLDMKYNEIYLDDHSRTFARLYILSL